MKFKPGDFVITTTSPPETSEWKKGDILMIKRIETSRFGGTAYFFEEGFTYGVFEDQAELAPKNSKLNKKLYPAYKEYNGFLIPPETADRITG